MPRAGKQATWATMGIQEGTRTERSSEASSDKLAVLHIDQTSWGSQCDCGVLPGVKWTPPCLHPL
jgi:hypothetical protein